MDRINELANINWEENPELISKRFSLILRKMSHPREIKDKKRNLLTKSNAELEEKICDNLMKNTNNKNEIECFQSINHLVNTMEMLDHKLDLEKCYLKDFKKQIDQKTQRPIALNHETPSSKRRSHGIGGGKAADVEKRKEIMQQKLHVEKVNLSKELMKNAELREKINLLMNEKKRFNREYDNLLAKLKYGKTILEDLTQSINNVCMVRNNLTKKMEKIQLNENKQKKLQTEEAYDLQMRISQEIASKNYNDQLRTRKFYGNVLALKKMTIENEANLHNELNKYKKMIESIKLCTANHRDIHQQEIVDFISKGTQEVFSLITYDMQINDEYEVMKEKLLAQQKQIRKKTLEKDEMMIFHHNEVAKMKFLLSRLQELRYENHDFLEEQKRLFNKLLDEIENLIYLTDCDVSPLLLLLGENNKATQFNYKGFLHTLETKLCTMMKILKPPKVSAMLQKTSINLPNGEQYTSIIITRSCPKCFSPKQANI